MHLFKVVWTDGYARETVAERVVEENLSFLEADAYCRALREASNWESDWWIVKPQSARLRGGLVEFV